jgi:hypothetical protein
MWHSEACWLIAIFLQKKRQIVRIGYLQWTAYRLDENLKKMVTSNAKEITKEERQASCGETSRFFVPSQVN